MPVRHRFPPLTESADIELVELAQAGDADATEVLIERYRRFARAKGRGYFVMGGDADDLEQEALIGLYKAVRDFEVQHEASFRGFAELCITRQIITAVKTATRQKHQPLNQYVSISGTRRTSQDEGADRNLEDLLGEATVSDPADKIVSAEGMERMRASLDGKLSTLEVDVLSLYVRGTSYQEISNLLARPVKSIDNALQRIKRKVTEHLDEEAQIDRELALAS